MLCDITRINVNFNDKMTKSVVYKMPILCSGYNRYCIVCVCVGGGGEGGGGEVLCVCVWFFLFFSLYFILKCFIHIFNIIRHPLEVVFFHVV